MNIKYELFSFHTIERHEHDYQPNYAVVCRRVGGDLAHQISVQSKTVATNTEETKYICFVSSVFVAKCPMHFRPKLPLWGPYAKRILDVACDISIKIKRQPVYMYMLHVTTAIIMMRANSNSPFAVFVCVCVCVSDETTHRTRLRSTRAILPLCTNEEIRATHCAIAGHYMWGWRVDVDADGRPGCIAAVRS